MPRVTVITATYNWSTVLPYSIGSVLRQTFTDWELLVVGDGCTDDSEEIVQRIATDDERVRWINLPENSGEQSTPNNEGLRQARGELIAYLGHDDLWLPHHLSCLVEAIDDGADIAHTAIRLIYPEGYPEEEEIAQLMRRPPSHFLLMPSSSMHKRSITEHIGGWRHYKEISQTPQNDLWRRVHAAGYRFTFVPRLTTIKFPAARRQNVYRERPCHEQAAWFERIGRESDLEAVELGKMFTMTHRIFYQHLHEQSGSPLRKKASNWLRRKLLHVQPESKKSGAKIEAWREFKGLDRKPDPPR